MAMVPTAESARATMEALITTAQETRMAAELLVLDLPVPELGVLELGALELAVPELGALAAEAALGVGLGGRAGAPAKSGGGGRGGGVKHDSPNLKSGAAG